MFISPKTAIDEGWITGITNLEEQIQPNAIDFTLDRLFSINNDQIFIINETTKKMRGGKEILPHSESFDNNDYWSLEPNECYDGMSNCYVKIPKGVAALLIVRSTFNRNGIFITSGIFDSQFSGNIGFAIHNRSGKSLISPGTRIGQIVFIESDSVGGYKGQYNTERGQHYLEAIKYK